MKYLFLVLLSLLTACTGESENTLTDEQLCEMMDGRVYQSDRLLEIGGVSGMRRHMPLEFYKGDLSIHFSDTVFDGSYYCENGMVYGVVLNGSPQVMTDVNSLSSIQLTVQNESIAYSNKPVVNRGLLMCEAELNGKLFTESDGENNPASFVHFKDPEFGVGWRVEYSLAGETKTLGIYDGCSHEIHLHKDVDDVNPIILTLDEETMTLFLDEENSTRTFDLQSSGGNTL